MHWRTESADRAGYSQVNSAVNRCMRAVPTHQPKGTLMNNIVYIVGAIVIIAALLSFLGLR